MRRWEGWEPAETHVHYDVDGNETGRTVVTREPEYDDAMRQLSLDYLAYLDDKCDDCGGQRSQCHNAHLDRQLKHAEAECLDKAEIKTYLAHFHQQNQHKAKPEECEACKKVLVWVDSYTPKVTTGRL